MSSPQFLEDFFSLAYNGTKYLRLLLLIVDFFFEVSMTRVLAVWKGLFGVTVAEPSDLKPD